MSPYFTLHNNELFILYICMVFFYKYNTVEISSAGQKSNLVLPSADMAKFVVNYMLQFVFATRVETLWGKVSLFYI